MRTTLLLGAGASKFAGIPTTKDLVAELRKRVASLGDQFERPTMKFFASNVLEETAPKDVEDLYESVDHMLEAEKAHRTVTKCKTKGQKGVKRRLVAVGPNSDTSNGEPSEPPIDETDDIDNTITALESIKSAIRDLLLEKCMVNPDERDEVKAVYDEVLVPLGIRDVLTTNYDNVIETYCEEARMPLANGFKRSFHGDRRAWTGKFEDTESGALRLVKMHGSVTWQRDGDAVLELGRPGARGEEYDVMIYPEKGPKRYDKDIFPELELKFREVLADTDFLVVIGYSFRDKGINHMIKQRLVTGDQRGSMRLLYIDPNYNSGIMRLLGKEFDTRSVRYPTSSLLVHSTDSISCVYTENYEFDFVTSRWIESSIDTILSSNR